LEQPPAELRPELWGHQHSARQAAARRVVPVVRLSAQLSGHPRSEASSVLQVFPAVWPAWWSERPHSEAASVRRAVAVAPSCFRQVEGRPPAALPEPAWWQAPAAVWRQPAGAAAAQVMASPSEMKAAAVVVAEAVRPVASAPRARLPAEEAAVASGAKVQPQEAAEAESVPSAQRPGEAAAVSGAGVVLPPEAAGVALDAAAEPQQAVAAEGRLDAEVPRPGVVEVEQPAPSARQPAAGHPSAAPWACRPGRPLPWLAPRQWARSAHAMRRSRAASPSRQSWRAAGCEGLS